MLTCERVIHDSDTGRSSLIDVLSDLSVADLPLVVPALYVYAKTTEAMGEYVFRLELMRRNDLLTLAEVAMATIDVDDPVAYQEMVFQLANVVFDRPGYYDLQLWANQELLGSTALLVELE